VLFFLKYKQFKIFELISLTIIHHFYSMLLFKIISKSRYVFIPLGIVCIGMIIFIVPVKRSYTQPSPKREMRAVWISTVMNIDFPSSWKISPAEQKKELDAAIELHKKNHINTIIFQVRPTADAIYKSDIELWSVWLSSKQGQTPNPAWDPLAYMVELCHKNNMELHAWFNPFRAMTDTARHDLVDSAHITFTKPKWFIPYGRTLYFDPGLLEVRTYVNKVIVDVLKRYDIDGVHFDDYFYPYKIAKEEFKDSLTFLKNKGKFKKEQKGDWRRNNIDLFVKSVSDSIRILKPWVKFGIAPFGVWRNKADDPSGSDTRAGAPCYDVLYADVLKWLKNGWIDYITPQIYWHIGHTHADFKTLVDWWSKNSYGKHLYIGQAAYKFDPKSTQPEWKEVGQITKQVELIRSYKEIQGSMFFSSKSFRSNQGELNDLFQNLLYASVSLIPVMPWKDYTPPKSPDLITVKREDAGFWIRWKADESKSEFDKAKYFVVYRFAGTEAGSMNDARNIFAIVREPNIFIPDKKSFFGIFKKKYSFIITAVDRLHNESPASKQVIIKLKAL